MNAQIVEEPTGKQLDAATATLKLLADRTRLHLVWALLNGEHSVNELAAHIGVAAPAVSQHLAKLRLAQLVSTRRQGNRIYYSAMNGHVLRLVSEALFHADHLTSDGLAVHHLGAGELAS